MTWLLEFLLKNVSQSGDEGDWYRHARRGSYSGGYDDPYINDDPLLFHRRRSLSHGRGRSHSMIVPLGGQYAGSSSIPMPGSAMSYNGGYSSYMPASYPGPGMQMDPYGQHLQPYGSTAMVPIASTSYQQPLRHRSSSVSIVPPPVVYSAAPPPVVLSTSSRRSKHRHSRSASRRSRSSDPTMRLEYPGYSASARY